MLTVLFSSRSITKPQFLQRYIHTQSGMSCLRLQIWHILVVSRSSIIESSFPKCKHLKVSKFGPSSGKTHLTRAGQVTQVVFNQAAPLASALVDPLRQLL